jgi:hypothetical protein
VVSDPVSGSSSTSSSGPISTSAHTSGACSLFHGGSLLSVATFAMILSFTYERLAFLILSLAGGVQELLVDPLPQGAKREGALYPDGAHITNLKVVREMLYKMQRPAISPDVRSPSPLHLAKA